MKLLTKIGENTVSKLKILPFRLVDPLILSDERGYTLVNLVLCIALRIVLNIVITPALVGETGVAARYPLRTPRVRGRNACGRPSRGVKEQPPRARGVGANLQLVDARPQATPTRERVQPTVAAGKRAFVPFPLLFSR